MDLETLLQDEQTRLKREVHCTGGGDRDGPRDACGKSILNWQHVEVLAYGSDEPDPADRPRSF